MFRASRNSAQGLKSQFPENLPSKFKIPNGVKEGVKKESALATAAARMAFNDDDHGLLK